MSQLMPFNLHGWISEHRHLLQPPVGNACIWNSNFLVMVVGGPNQRADYHVNPGEELFFQVEGDIVLKIIEDGPVSRYSDQTRAKSSCCHEGARTRRKRLPGKHRRPRRRTTQGVHRGAPIALGIARSAATCCMTRSLCRSISASRLRR